MRNKLFLATMVSLALTGCNDDTISLGSNTSENIAPSIQKIENQTVRADAYLAFQVKATDPNGDRLSYSLLNNSSWIAINSTGEISLTPSTRDIGNHYVKIRVSDGLLDSEMTFTVKVTPISGIPVDPDAANHAPVVTQIATQTIENGSMLSLQVEATDQNDDELSYKIANADSFPWARINESGELSLSPEVEHVGRHDISVQVSDGSLTSTMTFSVEVMLYSTDLEPPTTATYQGKLIAEGRVLTNSLDTTSSIICDGQALDSAGQFPFTVENGEKSIQCDFGSLSNLITVNFSFSDLLGKNGEPEQVYVRNFDIKADGDLGGHYDDAVKLLSYINTCSTETNKLCLDDIDSYDIIDLYRSNDKASIEAFVNPVVADEGEQPSSHVDPELKPEVDPDADTNLGGDFVSANAEAAYEYIPSLESKPLTTGKLLDTEESPNDFDKNHKFKVDAHLVM